jgi:putative PIN family toxin of toxin-antitoxin system
MRLVLDTNVWIDWLVFGDPLIAPLKAAKLKGRVEIAVDAACLAELTAVLAYPHFKLDEAQRETRLAEAERCTVRHAAMARPITLPRCSDPDDQKFLELARDVQADWLITKDKALLGIRRNKLAAAGFRIGTPLQWANSAHP